jgi:hypothetical protein
MSFAARIEWDAPDDSIVAAIGAAMTGKASLAKLQKIFERARYVALWSVAKRERNALKAAMRDNTLGLEGHAKYRGLFDIGKVFQKFPAKERTDKNRGRGRTRSSMISQLATMAGGKERPIFGKLSSAVWSYVNTSNGSARIGFLQGKVSDSWQAIIASLQDAFTIEHSFGKQPNDMRRYWGALGMPLSQERELQVKGWPIFETIINKDNMPSLLEDRMFAHISEAIGD